MASLVFVNNYQQKGRNKRMPLKTGKSRKAFQYNVRELMRTGRPQKQALAIAYAQQRKKKRKKNPLY